MYQQAGQAMDPAMGAQMQGPGQPFDRIAAIEARLSGVEATITQMNIRLADIERRIGGIESRMWWMWITTILAIIGVHYLK